MLQSGLATLLGQRSLKSALHEGASLKPLDLDQIEDATLKYLLKTVRERFETPITAFFAPDHCHVRTCLVVADEEKCGKWMGIGLSGNEALETALTRMISFLQANKYGEPFGQDPNELSDLPFTRFAVDENACVLDDERASFAAVVEAALARYGDIGVAYATPPELAETQSLACLRVLIEEQNPTDPDQK